MTELETLKELGKIGMWAIELEFPDDGRRMITLKSNSEILVNKIKLEKRQYRHDFIDLEDLRREAIKWIKSEIYCDSFVCSHEACINPRARVDWIKHFFNITEEDLKVSEGQK